jgi:long-chain acyl-CoA synthetase
MIVVICLVFNHDSIGDHFMTFSCYIHAGPDAVQFIVNHATVEVIFCVPQTLSTVRFNTFSQP